MENLNREQQVDPNGLNYIRARHLGNKAYHAAQSQKKSPYLPVLDELVPNRLGLSTVPLGIITVPLSRVVGTVSKGRTQAFACNFMPLLDEDTEFADKWVALSRSVLVNGMRDPVKMMEYMGRYYAVEGNKRISVMKFLDSPMIEGDVTRIIPEKTDEKANRVYFEYLDFYKDTKINYLEFTEEGSYAKLTELVGEKRGTQWSDHSLEQLRIAYSQFTQDYEVFGGDLLKTAPGDAFLLYLDAFGYEPRSFFNSAVVRGNLQKLRGEFRMRENETPISLNMNATASKPGLLQQLFRGGPNTLTVGFVHHRAPEVSGWTYWHTLGCNRIKSVFGEKLQTTMLSSADANDCEKMVDQLVENGARVIFTTSPLLLSGAMKSSLKHPSVKFLNCSLLPVYSAIRSYYLRMYEAKFIMGAIAGAMAENNRVGYIADYPVYGAPSSINAFALGAQLANPRAQVYLEWSTIRDHDPDAALIEKDVRVICNRDIAAPSRESDAYGLYIRESDRNRRLALPIWHWGRLYEDLIRRVFTGTWSDDSKDGQALNYWWGMENGAVDVFYDENLPSGTKRLTNLLRHQIRDRGMQPFANRFVSQDGVLRCSEGESLTPAQILSMNYLTDNVIGEIPKTETLKAEALDFVTLQGLRCIHAPDGDLFSWVASPTTTE